MSGDSTVCLVVCLGDDDEWRQYCVSPSHRQRDREPRWILHLSPQPGNLFISTLLSFSSVYLHQYIFLVKKNVQSVFLDICFSRKICLVKLILSKISLSMCQVNIVKTRREQKKRKR